MSSNGHIRLKRQFSLVPHSPDEVELRAGVWNAVSYTLNDESQSGRLYRLLVRLDGTASPGEIAESEGVPHDDVESLIDHLSGLGVVEFGPTSALDHYLDTMVPWRAPPEPGVTRPIVLLGEDDVSNEIDRLVRAMLPDSDIRRDRTAPAGLDRHAGSLNDGIAFELGLEAFEHWRGVFVIAASSAVHPLRMRALNRVCLALDIPWLHAAVDGPFIFVGPLAIPRRSACYECLETRITMNLRESASYQRYKRALVEGKVRSGRCPLEPALAGLMASHVALEAINFLASGGGHTVSKTLAIHVPTMEFAFHEVLRAPGCAACGSIAERDDVELYFDMAAVLGE